MSEHRPPDRGEDPDVLQKVIQDGRTVDIALLHSQVVSVWRQANTKSVARTRRMTLEVGPLTKNDDRTLPVQ